MSVIKDLRAQINRLKRLNDGTAIIQILKKPKYRKLIIQLNKDQLQDGINADGVSLGQYSQTSVNVFGKRAGHITLFDTGDLYKSINIKYTTNEFELTGDPFKENQFSPFASIQKIDLRDRFGEIFGLDEESIFKIQTILVRDMQKYWLEGIRSI